MVRIIPTVATPKRLSGFFIHRGTVQLYRFTCVAHLYFFFAVQPLSGGRLHGTGWQIIMVFLCIFFILLNTIPYVLIVFVTDPISFNSPRCMKRCLPVALLWTTIVRLRAQDRIDSFYNSPRETWLPASNHLKPYRDLCGFYCLRYIMFYSGHGYHKKIIS